MKATIYNASAGSGKTYRLAYKYVKEVINEPYSYRNILAVTFTNKATEEMKSRILRQINALASGQPSAYIGDLQCELSLSEELIRYRAAQAQRLILHDYSRFTILTIDTFFQRVLRAFIQEVGIDIGYSLEIESATIVEQGVDELIEQVSQSSELRQWLTDSINERVEEGKGWDIRKSILALSEQIFNEQAREALESGVPREELYKMVKRLSGEVESEVAKITEIAQKAHDIMTDNGVTYSDFKYASTSAVQLLRRYLAGELVEPSARSRAACSDLSVLAKKGTAAESVAPFIQPLLCEAVELIDKMLILNNTLQLYRENLRSYALLADLYQVVERICAEQNTMLLNQTGRVLGEFINEDDAPFIYEKVGSKFTRFMIDEFQDTSRREWSNFLPLLRNAIAESDVEDEPILIVGDIKQSIYRWRGGDWRLLGVEARSDLGDRDTEVIDMVNNYRSLPRVVAFNNEMIERVVASVNSSLNEELSAARANGSITDDLYSELQSTIAQAYTHHAQESPSGDRESGFVEVVSYREQPPLIERICGAIDRGYRPCDILILTRKRGDATKVAKILLEFKAANSDPRYNFDVMTQEALLVGGALVSRFIISVMMLSIDPNNTIQRTIYNQFLDAQYLNSELSDDALALFARVRMLSPIEAFEAIIIEFDLNKNSENIAYVQAIHDQVINFSNNRIGDIALFVEWWHEKGAKKSISVERSLNAIEVLTIHKAKGLEKKVVIIPYTEWEMDQRSSGMIRPIVWADEGTRDERYFDGAFPVFYKKSMGQSLFAADYYRERIYSHLDSINLLYVALTRAAESLHIFIPTTEKGSAKGVGEPILGVLSSMEFDRESGEGVECFSRGDRSALVSVGTDERGDDIYILDRYDSSPAELRLRIATQPRSDEAVIQPREMGVLLHAAFDGARSSRDIYNSLELLCKNGQINNAELELLRERVAHAMESPEVAHWFDGDWDDVRCECEIITPEGELLRPDRVMIKGDSCVVVDYKFGDLRLPKHNRQVERYVKTLQRMGYHDVQGAVWYVLNND